MYSAYNDDSNKIYKIGITITPHFVISYIHFDMDTTSGRTKKCQT